MRTRILSLLAALALLVPSARAQKLDIQEVEGQVLGSNATRLLDALAHLGAPLKDAEAVKAAAEARDARKLQQLLDPRVLVQVTVNPEARVKAARGPAADHTKLQQNGFVPVILKVVNEGGVKSALNMTSPQAGPVYSGGFGNSKGDKNRFMDIEVYRGQPMTANLSSARVEYVLGLLYSSEAGKREVTLAFDVGQGTQDLGFRGELPILFDIRPAVPVKFVIRDYDGKPSTGRLTFRDAAGHVYPSRAKRLAPDFFFQDQVYRHDGGTVLLPPGELTLSYGRGPEYHLLTKKIHISEKEPPTIALDLKRWINPMDHGFYSGDHHIHAAGCAHYTSPTEGVHADDMFLHVKGEGLNVGCNLTWGPCYEYQRQFFEPGINKVSEPFTIIKYDVEVSGFGSQLLGHVCLLNLRDQTYPGSDGTKTRGWPTWTTPLMRWAKQQGAVTGYAHSANGLIINDNEVQNTARRIVGGLDTSKDGVLSKEEAAKGLLPEAFEAIDADGDSTLTVAELAASVRRQRNVLPNLVVPPMDGIGAQEICVTTAQGLCDFISAMDTARIPEWNCWYHLMNCGFPLKASGETDFPCISGSRVGQGRVYVQLGKVDRIDFTAWCEGLRKGRSYISDGYAHALEFTVGGKSPGDELKLAEGGKVAVKAKAAFAANPVLGTAVGAALPAGKTRKVELVVNGVAVAAKDVLADDQVHELSFEVPIERSSWVALRHFPQMHTNPVNVLVGGKPIRASRQSALWCLGTIDQLWRVRARNIDEKERGEAQATFERTKDIYRKIAAESP